MDNGKLLAEWFWTDRWMGSSGFLLPIAARGLYREMLTQAWRRGAKLPNDHEAIRRACGVTPEEWAECWPKVRRYWSETEDRAHLVNLTQVEVYADTLSKKETAVHKAKMAAAARWGTTQDDAQAYAQAQPEECPPSPSPSPSKSQSPNDRNPTDSSSRTKRDKALTEAADVVIAHYKSYHPKARPGKKERGKILARLREGYSAEDLCAAIDGNHRSPHHCGENNAGTRYHALELIVRDSSKVAWFMEVPERTPSGSLRKSVRVMDNWTALREQNDGQDGP